MKPEWQSAASRTPAIWFDHSCSVVIAAMAGDRNGSTGPALDTPVGCWDCPKVMEVSLFEFASGRTISEDMKRSLQVIERTRHERASRAILAQLAVAPQQGPTLLPAATDTESHPSRSIAPAQDGYQASFHMDIPHRLGAAKERFPRYERTAADLFNTNTSSSLQPIAVTSGSGESGTGNTATCVLALCGS